MKKPVSAAIAALLVIAFAGSAPAAETLKKETSPAPAAPAAGEIKKEETAPAKKKSKKKGKTGKIESKSAEKKEAAPEKK